MGNDGLRIIASKDNLFFLIVATIIFFPLFGGVIYIVNQERLFPSLVFIATGDIVTLILYICHLLYKKSYFFQIAIIFFIVGSIFAFGGWLAFTAMLSNILKNNISSLICYIVSAMIFLSYSIMLFIKYHVDFSKNEHSYLKGIDFSTGIIDPLKTKLFNSKINENEIAHSPFFIPVKILLFIGMPLGAAGSVILFKHAGESTLVLVLGLASYCLSIIGIISGMPGYYSLFTIARLQIKHKKRLLLITGNNSEKLG
jgi:hypothetical protein